jgi:hypothetical protein
MQFELKVEQMKNSKNYYLNIKIVDSIAAAKILSIWSTDSRIEEIYKILKYSEIK